MGEFVKSSILTHTFNLLHFILLYMSFDIMLGIKLSEWWFTFLLPGCRRRRYHPDFFDYDLPPPSILPSRVPMTRPSSPDSASPRFLVLIPQIQSLLLDLLPLEIRQHIWSYALGGHTIHLKAFSTGLVGLYCLSADPSTCNDKLCPMPPKRMKKLSSLLKTCRQM